LAEFRSRFLIELKDLRPFNGNSFASILFAVAYEVSTPVYEGPFDLLLHLITKEQVDLYEISLSRIVDAFLQEIEKMQVLDLDIATEFLLIAATLVELKLRRLLPERGNVEMDEELGLLEERDLLLAKLLEYQTFRHAAHAMRIMEQRAGQSFPRTNVLEARFVNLSPDLLASVTPEQLRTAFVKAYTRESIPKPEPKVTLDHVTDVRFTVADAVNEIAAQLPSLGRATFRALTIAATKPIELIVRFLAVLELFKQGWIDIDQGTSFGEMNIIWCPDGPEKSSAPVLVAVDRSFADEADDDVDPDDVEAEEELELALARVRSEPNAVEDADNESIEQVRPVFTVDDYEG
jgi:segregation and condensation protein A